MLFDIVLTSTLLRLHIVHRSFAGHNPGGMPLEYMVQLANHVGAAPWFTLNHMADDDFHRQFAQQVKATLRPDVKVYVEWSNEACEYPLAHNDCHFLLLEAICATGRNLRINLADISQVLR